MRVLLDENLPRALASELTGHDVSTVQAAGWSGTQNGELLRQARERFDALLTMDRGLPHQHNLSLLGLRIVIAVLLLMAAGCAEDSLRLHARLALSCAVGETARPTAVGDGRIGVNTTFRAAPTAATMDENILSMYFYNAETEEMETPGADILAGRVWVIDEHDIDDRYPYREGGVVVCYRINE